MIEFQQIYSGVIQELLFHKEEKVHHVPQSQFRRTGVLVNRQSRRLANPVTSHNLMIILSLSQLSFKIFLLNGQHHIYCHLTVQFVKCV